MPRSALGDRRLIAQAGLALALANLRYWTTVAPIVRRELKRWEQRAQTIDDPESRTLALEKLRGEGFHAEAAAMLATLAPRENRDSVVEAIVALELLFDYLDGLTERPSADPLADGERLFNAFIDAVAAGPDGTGDLETPQSQDGYLEVLSRSVVLAIARLPAATAITDVARRTAKRSAQAQIRMHAVPQLGQGQLEEWAQAEAQGTELGWREFVAGAASSVLVLHALTAAAADPRTTSRDAEQIAETYLSICVLLTLLDGLVDYEQDTSPNGRVAPGHAGHQQSDRPGYLDVYEDRSQLLEVLGQGARRAAMRARALPDGASHVMILVGVVAYYSSAPGAEGALARPVIAQLLRELAPLISPTLAVMRAWRGARRRTRSSSAKGEK